MAKKPGDDGKVIDLKTRKPRGRRVVSSVQRKLPPDLLEKLNAAIAEGTLSVDELHAIVKDAGVSRSAIGRYKVGQERALEEYRRAQSMAAVWGQEREANPQSHVSQLLNELMKTQAFHRLMGMSPEDAAAMDPKDGMFLSGMIKNIAQADKLTADRVLQIRKQAVSEQRERDAAALKQAVSKGDIDATAAQRAREILGFA